MTRTLTLAYGIVCYAIFFVTFGYSIGFIGNLVVPKAIDGGTPGPLGAALVIDLALLSLFAVQHSGMARPAFKRWWTRIVPEPVERSTYTLLSSVALIVTYAFWQPIGGTVWEVQNPAGHAALTALYFGGWVTVFYATCLIDHFDLFGLRQVWLAFRGRPYTHKPFDTPSLYRFVRHPLYLGWFTVMWATPRMSLGHLLFAAVASGYILVAILFEERDLIAHFGDTYRRYRETTPRFIPRLGRRHAGREEVEAG